MNKILDFLFNFQRENRLLFVFFLVSIFALLGYKAFDGEIEAFPEFTNVQIQVITQVPGKASEEMERQVTVPIETGLNGVPGVISQRSISMFGLSVVTLTFDDHVKNRDARINVSQKLADIELPEGIKPELGADATPVGEVFRYTIEGDLPVDELRLIQDWLLEREFKSIPGIADVVTFGGPQRTVDVIVSMEKLKKLGLSVDEVAKGINANHKNAGGSLVTLGEESYVFRSVGLYNDIQDLNNAVIASYNNSSVKVKDIGKVVYGSRMRLGQIGRNEQDDVVMGILLLRSGENTLKTCEKVKEKIKFLNEKVLPKGNRINAFYDRTELIERSSGTVYHNVIFGIILVVGVLLVGLGLDFWKFVVAVAFIIPFALLSAIVGVRLGGYSPNLISLGAVDFGIIIESAIFAVESLILTILRFKKEDKKIEQKDLVSTLSSVLGPAFLCAFILIIAFIPILSLQRVEGRIFRPLGITLVSALIGGQIGALLFIPFSCSWLPNIRKVNGKLDHWIDALADKLISIKNRCLNINNFKIKVFFLLTICLVCLTSTIGREFLPNLNEGAIWARAIAPKSISREKAVELAEEARVTLKEIPEVTDVVSQIGRPDDGTDTNGFDNLEFFVVLGPQATWKSADTIDGFIKLCQNKLKKFDGVEFGFSQPIKDNVDEAASGVKGELVVKIFGRDLRELQKIANESKNVISQISGAADVTIEELMGQPELRLDINKELVARNDLSVEDVQSVVESTLLGLDSTRILDHNNRLLDVVVKPEVNGEVLSDLRSFPIFKKDGGSILIGEVTDLNRVEGVNRIYREMSERRIAVRISVRDRAVVDFVQEASARLAKEVKLPQYYRFEWAGSFENAQRAGMQLLIVVPICLVLILVTLYTWFKNWQDVGFVFWQTLFSLPVGLAFLKIFDLNLSISAAAGAIVLIGISFLNAIMFISEFKHLKDMDKTIRHSVKGLLISNLVAIVGLIPAAFSTEIGSETAKPFAVMILGGLIGSLVFTLTVFPALVSFSKRKPVEAATDLSEPEAHIEAT
jgi:heavy metal efflux system protein